MHYIYVYIVCVHLLVNGGIASCAANCLSVPAQLSCVVLKGRHPLEFGNWLRLPVFRAAPVRSSRAWGSLTGIPTTRIFASCAPWRRVLKMLVNGVAVGISDAPQLLWCSIRSLLNGLQFQWGALFCTASDWLGMRFVCMMSHGLKADGFPLAS